jgi:hypothetical protein
MAEFLKNIAEVVDSLSSTFGYEILNEPHIDNSAQWSQIGKFNSFITTELRDITNKTIIYSMSIPVDLNSPINISPENLAKMAPSFKENIVFKTTVYGVPIGDEYQEKRFDLFLKTRSLTGVPLYIGEWNNVQRIKEDGISKIKPGLSELTEIDAKQILGFLKKAGVWGTAFWRWDYQGVNTASFNLVYYNNGKLEPTKYLNILKDSVGTIYGSYGRPSISYDNNENNLANEFVNSGKFKQVEAKELASKIMHNRPDDIITSDNSQSLDNKADKNTLPSNIIKNEPQDYDHLDELIDDIKNKRVNFETSLNAFKNSGAYLGTDEEMQDCINLAGKIGNNLIDYEIVRCSEDTNFFQNQVSHYVNKNKDDTGNNKDNSNNISKNL